MRIAILGTKGIPNNYGGFEQFTQYLSEGLVARGHDITVYNPHFHPYTKTDYNGVKIERVYSPENIIGSSANYIYDYLSLRHALKRGYDIIYEAGYGSVAFSYLLLPIHRTVLITNMDGLEWKRAKWNRLVKFITRKAEAVAVKKSTYLISDNIGIQKYYKDEFNIDSFFLPYGATIPEKFDESTLVNYNVRANDFYLLIARMEPENNIEMMLRAFQQSQEKAPLLVIGNAAKGFGKYMAEMFANEPRIRFLGGIYNKEHLDSLRHYAKAYFHGHSVGGTNPSLLEAMSCSSFIISHDNQFNRAVLGNNALFFESEPELRTLINGIDSSLTCNAVQFKAGNLDLIRTQYDWEFIIDNHEKLFVSILKNRE